MAKKMLIDATHPEETRVVVADGSRVEEFDFESINKRQLAGNIYLAKVTRVEPSLQAAFIEYGGNRHGFLAFSEIHPDYYQIPQADREALLAEQAAQDEDEEDAPKPRAKSRRARKPRKSAEAAETDSAAADPLGDDPRDEAGDENGDEPDSIAEDAGVAEAETVSEPAEGEGEEGAAKPKRRRRTRKKPAAKDETENDEGGEAVESVGAASVEEEAPAPRRAPPRRYKIQEVIKVRQILLVQVVKEERGNKGAALTTYLSLAGRYCVLMPNSGKGGGISRKITDAADRKKLKAIAGELEVPKGMGLIIRTAGSQRTKTEIKRDYEFLLRQWEQVRELTLQSVAPTLIYEEGSLIKRSIRDLYAKEIDEILVEGDEGYREAKDYMRMLMPSHAKNVKPYKDPIPLFSRHQVEGYLTSMFNPVVQLKSGGYIVIGVTEALVAIDVNSGRSTREGSIEETALKTNLEAAEEVARQLRLRDLAGLIVIDFIDMDERRNNTAVEKRLKDKLKTDRARLQIGRISGFGLLEMSRQRLRPGMLEASTAPCPHCHGTGLIRSPESLALSILRELEEEGVRGRSSQICVSTPIQVANYILNHKRAHVAAIEERYEMSVLIEADATLVAPDHRTERVKAQTPRQIEARREEGPVVRSDGGLAALDDPREEEEAAPESEARTESGDGGKKRRRGRRGGKKRRRNGEGGSGEASGDAPAEGADAAEAAQDAPSETPAETAAEEEATRPRRRRRRAKLTEQDGPVETSDAAAPEAPAPSPETAPEQVDAAPEPEPQAEPAPELAVAEAEPEPATEPERPKRRGWWSFGL